ncbi:hypothetical protein [Flavobacterium muglaense]|uniref:Uncharacterized protein n=1 Tax=Flavobacterium muglaense TaxID=2764716 RepID=A0A923SF01_9FLAO|nr:hypothetical protein [Flavobacterium muglaense]MBC5836826.1 hypothetical protein [Flavobacterium muglaense]MBC5843224.1 hypothetical protein [Flavobacterium muglaense]
MKTSIALALLLSLFLNCKNKPKMDSSAAATMTEPIKTSGEWQTAATTGILVPLDILDKKSSNKYEKYGVEFSGNCYACDLAQLKITSKQLTVSNVCNPTNNVKLTITKQESSPNQIKIVTKNNQFLFVKIDPEPIYQLNIISGPWNNLALRLSPYYTIEKKISHFTVHDCGDFQG